MNRKPLLGGGVADGVKGRRFGNIYDVSGSKHSFALSVTLWSWPQCITVFINQAASLITRENRQQQHVSLTLKAVTRQVLSSSGRRNLRRLATSSKRHTASAPFFSIGQEVVFPATEDSRAGEGFLYADIGASDPHPGEVTAPQRTGIR
jgi:hypothetical protein